MAAAHSPLSRLGAKVEAFAASCRRAPLERLHLDAVRTLRTIAVEAAGDDPPAGETLADMTRLFYDVVAAVTQGVERVKAGEIAEKARAAARAEKDEEGEAVHSRRVQRFRELYQARFEGGDSEADCAGLRGRLESIAASAYDCWRALGSIDHVAFADAEGRDGLAELDFLLMESITALTGAKYAVSLARKLAE